jgi:hypothetical protein
MKVPLTHEQRCSHLPRVFRDLVARPNADHPLGTVGALSAAAAEHGMNRRTQGYSAAMLVEESRILQVTMFHTLQKNLTNINFSILLYQVMTIADEVDSQLGQAVYCYISESIVDTLPVCVQGVNNDIRFLSGCARPCLRVWPVERVLLSWSTSGFLKRSYAFDNESPRSTITAKPYG